ncbi:2-succinylbenzoate--CoA ligase [Haematobacter massiliensis]|uniref:2-succinylbenzoate--CoA ligase n=1 Tax=Haematobacter massiliensis TaxID=195105 RepID=A0A086XTI4_9RHOB|nr:AMP-binding protein [Haematobacter massiliensis]KFI25334.1 2-succinylbenzoate--CoA ligase [Haematobacter massiliensis]
MATLRERLAARPGTDVLIRENARDITVAEALAEGPKGLPPSARVLLSIHDTGALARTLVALDGGVEALLLASYSFSPEVVEALAGVAGITHIVTDREELLAARPAPSALEDAAPEDAVSGGGARPAAAATTGPSTGVTTGPTLGLTVGTTAAEASETAQGSRASAEAAAPSPGAASAEAASAVNATATAATSALQSGSPQSGSPQSGSPQSEPPQSGSTQFDPTQSESPQSDPTQSDPTQSGSPQSGHPQSAPAGAAPGRSGGTLPTLTPEAARGPAGATAPVATTWLMTTSGTTGVPKIVTHSVASLTRSVRGTRPEALPVWGLLYDMTRFAGMQVGLQAMTGHGTLAAIDRDAALGEQVAEMAAAGVTHLSATPTLWRRLLMAPGVEGLPLRQITLGGEIAEQPVLDAIRARFPKARVTHIYASTEIGVGFAVNDGRAGFPESYLSAEAPAGLAMRVEEGMLWLRPPEAHRTRYLGDNQLDMDTEGYVRTGDQVEIRPDTEGARVHFLGRDSGVVNVGGVKVYPERVEAVLTADPRVSLAQVTAKSSPITGNLLVATIVPADPAADRAALKRELMAHAQAHLEREAVPAMWRFADHLETNAAGKIVRSQAKA